MIEDDLRTTFASHEHLVPAAAAVLPGIDQGYRRRRQRRLAGRVGGTALLALLLVAAPALVLHLAGRGHAGPLPAASPDQTRPPVGDVNFLVVGLDSGVPDDNSRSDGVIIAHFSPASATATLISIERDTLVDVPADPAHHYSGGHDKINTAYLHGGLPLLRQTITQNWGITFAGTASFTYAGLRGMIDALGGVDLYVDSQTTSIHRGFRADGSPAAPFTFGDGPPRPVPGVKPVVYQVGFQHLTGEQAVDFARQRMFIADNGGAYSRDRHLRQLITVVAKALAAPGAPVDAVLAAARAGGATLDVSDMISAWLIASAADIHTVLGIGAKGRSTTVNGLPAEVLTADGVELLGAVKNGSLAAWIAAHPDQLDQP